MIQFKGSLEQQVGEAKEWWAAHRRLVSDSCGCTACAIARGMGWWEWYRMKEEG